MVDRGVLKSVLPLVLMLMLGLTFMWLGREHSEPAPIPDSPTVPSPAAQETTGWRPPPEEFSWDSETLEAELEVLYEEMSLALEEGNLDAFFASTAPDFTFERPDGTLFDRATVREQFQAFLDAGVEVSTMTTVLSVKVMRDGLIVAETSEIQTHTAPDGSTQAYELLSEELWYRHKDGRLLLQHVRSTSETVL